MVAVSDRADTIAIMLAFLTVPGRLRRGAGAGAVTALCGAPRRRIYRLAVVIVLIFAVGVGYEIKSTAPTYLESALVVFSLPKSQSAPYAYTMFAPSLITSGEAATQILMSPLAQGQIRQAGGTAAVSLTLVNLYNEQYPDYGEPLATLTAVSPNAANVHRSFGIAVRLLGHLLAARQAQASVPLRNRISARIIGDTGPVVQTGSSKRVYAGIALLALVAVSLVWSPQRRARTIKNHPAAV